MVEDPVPHFFGQCFRIKGIICRGGWLFFGNSQGTPRFCEMDFIQAAAKCVSTKKKHNVTWGVPAQPGLGAFCEEEKFFQGYC